MRISGNHNGTIHPDAKSMHLQQRTAKELGLGTEQRQGMQLGAVPTVSRGGKRPDHILH